jgi:hypothetical protein
MDSISIRHSASRLDIYVKELRTNHIYFRRRSEVSLPLSRGNVPLAFQLQLKQDQGLTGGIGCLTWLIMMSLFVKMNRFEYIMIIVVVIIQYDLFDIHVKGYCLQS